MNMKSDKPIRLKKKVSFKEKTLNWLMRMRPWLLLLLIILIFTLVFTLIFLYFPGTESGHYYNRGIEKCLR